PPPGGPAGAARTGVRAPPSSARSPPSAPPSRAPPPTAAPAPSSAAAMPRPNPRLAPVTSAVVPLMSLLGITILPVCCSFPPPVVRRLIDADQPERSESPRAGLQRTPPSKRQQKRRFNGGRTAGWSGWSQVLPSGRG